MDLEDVPDPLHAHVAKWVAGHPKGGIDIVDGPVTDVMPELRELSGPRGWPEGSTWDSVGGLLDLTTRRVIVGSQNVRRLAALHEFGHGVDEAGGRLSDSAEFRRVYDRLEGMAPYYTQPGTAGRQETFAGAFSAWVHTQYWAGDFRAAHIADELGLGAGQEHQGVLLDGYFLSLRNSL